MLNLIKDLLLSIGRKNEKPHITQDTKRQFTPVAEEQLLLFPQIDTKANYLEAFWKWVAILEQNNFQRAIESLCFINVHRYTPDSFESQIKTFFGGDKPWSVVIPNDRLVGVINDAAEFQLKEQREFGWLMAQIPLTNDTGDPKSDDILLAGLAVSFRVLPWKDQYVLGFEIFHA